MNEGIVTKTGPLPGPTVAIFGGVHGNEKVGILTVKKLMETLELSAGTVYLVLANPPAIEQDVRALGKNLNRLFTREHVGIDAEDARARELMDILDRCEALLDIHSYNSLAGDQFAITEPRGYEIVKKMDFPIVASGFSALGHGTDGYMESRGKVGICIECGTTNRYQEFLGLAETSAYQFLRHFGLIERRVDDSSVRQKIFTVKRMVYKQTEQFRFAKEYRDFELLPTDSPFVYDGETALTAAENEAIIFPRPDVPVGGEVCIVGEFSERV